MQYSNRTVVLTFTDPTLPYQLSKLVKVRLMLKFSTLLHLRMLRFIIHLSWNSEVVLSAWTRCETKPGSASGHKGCLWFSTNMLMHHACGVCLLALLPAEPQQCAPAEAV